METFNVKIWSNRRFEPVCTEKPGMTRSDIYKLRMDIRKDIFRWFDWKSYNPSLRHLVIGAEIGNEFYLYTTGCLMDDKEFYEMASRPEIGFVDAHHRCEIFPDRY